MIIEKSKSIFVHIPKTAGTSIATFLNDYYNLNLKKIYDHRMVSQYIQQVKNYKDYFSFAFIRNPYDRLVSYYCAVSGRNEVRRFKNYGFKDWLLHLDELKLRIGNNKGLLAPQYYFLTDQNENIIVSKVGRYENLLNDLKDIGNSMGIANFANLPHKNKGEIKPANFIDYLTKETEEIIYNNYKIDFDTFGYERLKI